MKHWLKCKRESMNIVVVFALIGIGHLDVKSCQAIDKSHTINIYRIAADNVMTNKG